MTAAARALMPRADWLRYQRDAAIVLRLAATWFTASTRTHLPAVSVAKCPGGGTHA
jgi:hypothetical protein